jgi:hypothetical protein
MVNVKVETYQIIGDDTLRLDISTDADVDQDGKHLTLDKVRQTIYVRADGKSLTAEVLSGLARRKDPRQTERI